MDPCVSRIQMVSLVKWLIDHSKSLQYNVKYSDLPVLGCPVFECLLYVTISLLVCVLSDVLVGVVELNQQDDCDGLQAPVPLLVLGLSGHGGAQLWEQLADNHADAVVDVVLVNLQCNVDQAFEKFFVWLYSKVNLVEIWITDKSGIQVVLCSSNGLLFEW